MKASSSGLETGLPARWPQMDSITRNSALGIWLTSSALGSFFYLIIGMHALHVVAALGVLVYTREQQRRRSHQTKPPTTQRANRMANVETSMFRCISRSRGERKIAPSINGWGFVGATPMRTRKKRTNRRAAS